MENVTKRIVVLQKGRKNVTKRNIQCYKNERQLLQKGYYVFLIVTKYVTKRPLKYYIKEH